MANISNISSNRLAHYTTMYRRFQYNRELYAYMFYTLKLMRSNMKLCKELTMLSLPSKDRLLIYNN
jgi:hypothetical protein